MQSVPHFGESCKGGYGDVIIQRCGLSSYFQLCTIFLLQLVCQGNAHRLSNFRQKKGLLFYLRASHISFQIVYEYPRYSNCSNAYK